MLIDVHTHILSTTWVDLLTQYGGHRYQIRVDVEGRRTILRQGARFMTLTPPMFDPDARLRMMDEAGVAQHILSYTCPNGYWADGPAAETVLRAMNDHLAEVCARWPDRFRGLASIPLQDVDLALRELDRAVDDLGMVGLVLLANVNDTPLDDARFEPLWAELNRRRLPVLIHPTVPPGADAMGMDQYGLVAALGFMFDSTLAIARLVLGGVFERSPDWPLIVPHAGATLPYLASRLNQCYRFIPDTRAHAPQPPSAYLKRFYYDTVCYDQAALQLALDFAGPDHLLYGSDYPHNIGDVQGCAARVDALPISDAEKDMLRFGNAQRLFNLDSH